MKITVRQILTLAVFSLCIALSSAGVSLAQERPAHGHVILRTTLNELLGSQQAERYDSIIVADEPLRWQVYLPDNGNDSLPGVMVYVSPHDSGRLDPRWQAVLDAHNLIYIAADESGNSVPAKRRMVLALMAIRVLAQRHAFAFDRIAVAGFSGGGRVASLLATQYPEVYTRALYICGVDFWEEKHPPDLERLVQNRFLFLTGARDFNRDETRTIYQRYLKAGAGHSKLMVIPGMSHAHPDSEAFEQALRFLMGAG